MQTDRKIPTCLCEALHLDLRLLLWPNIYHHWRNKNLVLCIKLPYQHQQQVKLGFTNDICRYVCGSTHEKVIWIIIGGFLHKSDVNLSTKTYRWLIQLILGGWFFKEKTTHSPYTTTRIGGSMYMFFQRSVLQPLQCMHSGGRSWNVDATAHNTVHSVVRATCPWLTGLKKLFVCSVWKLQLIILIAISVFN